MIPIFRPLILITFIFMGAIYPLSLIYFKMIQLNGDYQKAHIHVMNHLLQDGSSYVAGIELIYNKNQPIAGMRQLIGPAIDYLASPSAKLRSFMLASLYQDPNATAHSVIHDLKEQNVKFYVNTYRINALPTPIKTYLHSQYEHLWGSIYLYAPLMMAGNHHMMLKFAGRYLIEAPAMTNIILNGKSYHAQTLIELNKGTYFSMANHAYRLKLMPKDILPLLKQKFQREHLMKIVW